MSVQNQWIYTTEALQNSPSRRDGIDEPTEDGYRRQGVRHIIDIGNTLKLTTNPTLATASVFFNRFYMVHSFKQYPFPVTALGCLFLAGKVEETPKKCKDICAKAAEHNPSAYSSKTLVEEVFAIEKQLLQTLRFDLHVEHPYTFLLQYAKPLKLDKQQKATLVQTAWTFINDSQSTTLCLLWEPEIVAIALMYLSIKMNSMETLIDWEGRTSRDEQWWDMYVANLTTTMMEEICHKVLDYYQQVNNQNSAQAAS